MLHAAACRCFPFPPILASAVLILCCAGIACADDGIFYTRERSFQIPFHLDPGETRVQTVILHASTDTGKSYNNVATASPTERFLRYDSRGDGWYWFVVQTQDGDSKLHPNNPRTVAPGLKVCVDTLPPVVNLHAVQPREGSVA